MYGPKIYLENVEWFRMKPNETYFSLIDFLCHFLYIVCRHSCDVGRCSLKKRVLRPRLKYTNAHEYSDSYYTQNAISNHSETDCLM